MSAPRLEIDLDKIFHNARTLVDRLGARGISVTGVTKAALGSPDIAATLLRAGVSALGDSRIENIKAMRSAGISAPMTLIRSPMLSQVDEVVRNADLSLNSELDVIRELSLSGQRAGRTHEIMLMVELGDLREGIMPEDLLEVVRETLSLPNIVFRGIGTNLACRSGVSPDASNMAELSALALSIESNLSTAVAIVSGGNSANLAWALSGAATGRINDLRLGESILLGCETLHRKPIEGLYTDAMTLVAEVIESKSKPTQPRGVLAQTAFGEAPGALDRGSISQIILAIGIQDTDPDGLLAPQGVEILAASSDHLIAESLQGHVAVGDEMAFQLNYSALLRAMTSPFVLNVVKPQTGLPVVLVTH
jgi:predicted amino acid racemase